MIKVRGLQDLVRSLETGDFFNHHPLQLVNRDEGVLHTQTEKRFAPRLMGLPTDRHSAAVSLMVSSKSGVGLPSIPWGCERGCSSQNQHQHHHQSFQTVKRVQHWVGQPSREWIASWQLALTDTLDPCHNVIPP